MCGGERSSGTGDTGRSLVSLVDCWNKNRTNVPSPQEDRRRSAWLGVLGFRPTPGLRRAECWRSIRRSSCEGGRPTLYRQLQRTQTWLKPLGPRKSSTALRAMPRGIFIMSPYYQEVRTGAHSRGAGSMTDEENAALQALLPTRVSSVGRSGPVFTIKTDQMQIGVSCSWRSQLASVYSYGSGDEDKWHEIENLVGKRLIALMLSSDRLDLQLRFDCGTVVSVFCDTAHDPWRIDAPVAGYFMPLP